jgi:hypothetical protein
MTFKTWFKQQFGKLPGMTEDHRAKLLDKIKQADYAQNELDEDAELRDKWEAALYAWNAKEKR